MFFLIISLSSEIEKLERSSDSRLGRRFKIRESQHLPNLLLIPLYNTVQDFFTTYMVCTTKRSVLTKIPNKTTKTSHTLNNGLVVSWRHLQCARSLLSLLWTCNQGCSVCQTMSQGLKKVIANVPVMRRFTRN